MSQMFRQLPSVQEMIDALSSPIIPTSATNAVADCVIEWGEAI